MCVFKVYAALSRNRVAADHRNGQRYVLKIFLTLLRSHDDIDAAGIFLGSLNRRGFLRECGLAKRCSTDACQRCQKNSANMRNGVRALHGILPL